MPALKPPVRVLIVEDDPARHLFLQQWAEKAGVTAFVTGTAAEAVALANRMRMSAAIIADSGQDLDSDALAARLRTRSPDLPLVFLTDVPDRQRIAHYPFGPRATTVRRPFLEADLTAALARVRSEPDDETKGRSTTKPEIDLEAD